MKEQTITVVGYALPEGSDLDDEPEPVERTIRISADEVRFHPIDDGESTDGPTGLSLSELIEELEAEHGVTIDSGGEGDDEHDFEVADHPFDTVDELDECVDDLVTRIADWVRGR